jgi:hypothetical protein
MENPEAAVLTMAAGDPLPATSQSIPGSRLPATLCSNNDRVQNLFSNRTFSCQQGIYQHAGRNARDVLGVPQTSDPETKYQVYPAEPLSPGLPGLQSEHLMAGLSAHVSPNRFQTTSCYSCTE